MGTFTAIFMAPELFYTGSPFYLTMEGEFVAKNLVLLAAGLAIAGHEVRYY